MMEELIVDEVGLEKTENSAPGPMLIASTQAGIRIILSVVILAIMILATIILSLVDTFIARHPFAVAGAPADIVELGQGCETSAYNLCNFQSQEGNSGRTRQYSDRRKKS